MPRAGILKALLELDFKLAGEENEKKDKVNNLMKRAIKKGVESGRVPACELSMLDL